MNPLYLFFYSLITILFLNSCSTQQSANQNDDRYVFYLHGRIVELQGADAVSETYGKYEYRAILETFQKENYHVISEVRPDTTTLFPYAEKIKQEINALLKQGVPAQNITVIGGSKGAMIGAAVSTVLQNPHVNFVLIAGNSDGIEQDYSFNLYGNILTFYDTSDTLAGKSYQSVIEQSEGVTHFKEIPLQTGLGHGIVYKPLQEWVEPTLQWIENKYN